MPNSRIRLMTDADLEREEAFYAARHDRDARLIVRLIADLRWQRGLLASAKPWLEKAQEMARAALAPRQTPEGHEHG